MVLVAASSSTARIVFAVSASAGRTADGELGEVALSASGSRSPRSRPALPSASGLRLVTVRDCLGAEFGGECSVVIQNSPSVATERHDHGASFAEQSAPVMS
jgi:hypothetical protein